MSAFGAFSVFKSAFNREHNSQETKTALFGSKSSSGSKASAKAANFQLKLKSLRDCGDHLSEASLEMEEDTVETEPSAEGNDKKLDQRPSLESVEEISEEIPADDEGEEEGYFDEEVDEAVDGISVNGTGSLSSGSSARSVSTHRSAESLSRSRSRLDDSLSSGSAASFPNGRGNGTAKGGGARSPRSKSIEGGGGGGARAGAKSGMSQKRKKSSAASASARNGVLEHLPRTMSGKKAGVAENRSARNSLGSDDLPDVSSIVNPAQLQHQISHPGSGAGNNELLPRITGTKSQASTASSSATRDSGISLATAAEQTRVAAAAAAALVSSSTTAASSHGPKRSSTSNSSRVGSQRGRHQQQQQLSRQSSLGQSTSTASTTIDASQLVNVNGHAVSLHSSRGGTSHGGSRPGTNASRTHEEQQRTLSRLSSKYQQHRQTPVLPNGNGVVSSSSSNNSVTANSKRHPYHADDERDAVDLALAAGGGDIIGRSKSENNLPAAEEDEDDLSPPRSPKYPLNSDLSSVAPRNGGGNMGGGGFVGGGGGGVGGAKRGNGDLLLLRPAENSPFVGGAGGNSAHGSQNSVAGTAVSTPFSQASVPSSYEYDDDFTSDEESEAMSVRTAGLGNSQGGKSKRPAEMSAQSQRTVTSTTSAGSGSAGLSRIPIKRNSSMRRKKEIMENYSPVKTNPMANGGGGGFSSSTSSSAANQASKTLPRRNQQQNRNGTGPYQHSTKSLERGTTRRKTSKVVSSTSTSSSNRSPSKSHSKSSSALNTVDRDQAEAAEVDPFRKSAKVKNSPRLARKGRTEEPNVFAAAFEKEADGGEQQPPAAAAEETSEKVEEKGAAANGHGNPLNIEAVTSSDDQIGANGAVRNTPFSAPATKRPPHMDSSASGYSDYHNSDDMTVESISRLSTANSTVSNSSYQHVQLRTLVTLKSPFEGQPVASPPPPPPEAYLAKCLEQMGGSDWESNVSGMTGVVRLARHEPELLLVEYKTLMGLLLKQIKNLRSQVCRAAAHTLSELFSHLKKSMESDLEKVAVPLIHKTGDTNKFLREDCHVALDAMVDNLSANRVISILTSEVMLHKNPTVRGTVSRLLAYLTVERHGVERVFLVGGNPAPSAGQQQQQQGGPQSLAERVAPAVAKLAQDGSQEARQYARATLAALMDRCPDDWERLLRRNLTQNTMRNLEKVLEVVKSGGGGSNGRKTPVSLKKHMADMRAKLS